MLGHQRSSKFIFFLFYIILIIVFCQTLQLVNYRRSDWRRKWQTIAHSLSYPYLAIISSLRSIIQPPEPKQIKTDDMLKSKTLRGGRDLVAFRGSCSDRNRTKAINYIYISKCCNFTSKHDGKGFMAISAIAASFCLVKRQFSRKLTFNPDIFVLPLGQILTQGRNKNMAPIVSNLRARFVGLCCEGIRCLGISLETPGRSYTALPLH